MTTGSPLPISSGPVPTSELPVAPATPAPFAHRLDAPLDYNGIFTVVRDAVLRVLHRERPGLGLALSNLPPQLGAYWQLTGNLIVMNEGLVLAMQAQASTVKEYNSFVFVILAHEYLHSLGYLEESDVRPVTELVAREALGADHPATRMAHGDLWQQYPGLRFAPPGDGRRLKIVPRFDLGSTSQYIR
ncbi:MAG TPA: hypothetical protein VGV89_02130 [Thermoplasmata archaeon]|nr:hypothetical protein [Thermoplasmata archaeon]